MEKVTRPNRGKHHLFLRGTICLNVSQKGTEHQNWKRMHQLKTNLQDNALKEKKMVAS
jgi:hypothetical protein